MSKKIEKDYEVLFLGGGFVTPIISGLLKKFIVFGDEVMPNEFNLAVEQFKKTVQKIRKLGVGVVLVSPTSTRGSNIGDCLLKKHQFNLHEL